MATATSAIFDALVVGAGPAGSATALMLARSGWHVGLMHRRNPRIVRTGETLPGASRSTLGALGVWSKFSSDGHVGSPGTVSWWGADTPIEQDSVFSPSGQGWHVNRQRFDRMLLDAAREAGAAAIEETRLVDVRLGGDANAPDCWCVKLQTSGRVRTCGARILIVATGRSTPAAPQGITRQRFDRLIGLGAVVSPAATLTRVDRRIWIEATPAGWWYSAPMPDEQWTVTFFTDADQTPTREGRGVLARYWLAQLARAPNTERRLASLEIRPGARSTTALADSLQVIAADSHRKVPCQGPNWLAVGDAASAWDPLSGQGIEKALRSGLRAARAADELLRAADGGRAVLADYARHVEEQERLYHDHHYLYYAQVRRWPKAVFWQRRHVREATGRERRQ